MITLKIKTGKVPNAIRVSDIVEVSGHMMVSRINDDHIELVPAHESNLPEGDKGSPSLSWEDKLERIRARVNAALPDFSRLIYSAYDKDENDDPVDNLDVIPIQGKVIFIYGGFVSGVMHSPTWLEIAGVADQAIRFHHLVFHVYLEGVIKQRQVGEITIAEILFGS